ncbi:Protein-lysine N-methyltransferase EFM2 [Drechslerella dactyloides]|uniref:Protein-lysine N-methyltransferase EFM2 n=1 Tax=Drechslerella dactyloides TaxID=74499 RepID=A0AAD6J4U1_DREDA|nr:Protein-lysine N-methyltransferase EFM2 [Drechslerella dactyloides]
MTREQSDETEDVLDVLDLPPLYLRPPLSTLLTTLDLLAVPPPSWDLPSTASAPNSPCAPTIHIRGNPAPWLTSLVSSSLRWLADDTAREMVWETASMRLAERCGRTAMPAIDRSFQVADGVAVKIHEPTLDGDNLGLKTWGAAYALAKRMAGDEGMRSVIRGCLYPQSSSLVYRCGTDDDIDGTDASARVLELGAGTGLAGLAVATTVAAAAHIHLTDLPEILPNLVRNVALNAAAIPPSVSVSTGILDWRVHTSPAAIEDAAGHSHSRKEQRQKYPLIIAADPIYSAEHPSLLATVVAGWLERTGTARFIVELPLRKLFGREVEDFRRRMHDAGLVIVDSGEESARDDWGDGGEAMDCWWGVYAWGHVADGPMSP